jgi:hypothetical protein
MSGSLKSRTDMSDEKKHDVNISESPDCVVESRNRTALYHPRSVPQVIVEADCLPKIGRYFLANLLESDGTSVSDLSVEYALAN